MLYVKKENIEAIIDQLGLDGQDYAVYVDLRFYIKNINNPAIDYVIKYYTQDELVRSLSITRKLLSDHFKTSAHMIYSTNKVYYDELPEYKSDFYDKYMDDEDVVQNSSNFLNAFRSLKNLSTVSGDKDFIDPSEFGADEFEFIKQEQPNKKLIVISRETIFEGYDDIILITPDELNSGVLKEKSIPNYYKVILSLIGYESYSLEKIPGIGIKTAEKIINRLLDNNIYIYYNSTRERQPVFPIRYEDLVTVSKNITRDQYNDIILSNWKFLNR